MSNEICEQVRTRIALGEDEANAGASDHLRVCGECRLEANRIKRLTGVLARTAARSVPAGLDRAVLSLLSGRVGVPESILRPRLAIALAVVALLAGILALAGWGGEPDAESPSPIKIVLWVWVYLGFASVATLPMLVHHALGQRKYSEGIQK